MKNNTHRISNNIILKEYKENISKKFWDTSYQYVLADSKSWDNTIWTGGEFAKSRNKSYSNTGLIKQPELENAIDMSAIKYELILKQGFRFSPDGVIGLQFIVLDMGTNKILVSQYLTEDDFSINKNKLIIDGNFWLTSTNIYLPKPKGVVCVGINEITKSDINNETGFIYTFTTPSEILVDKKEMVETLQTNLSFDENFYLSISLKNNSNVSLKQSLYDYIGYEPQEILVSYNINYGNDIYGYKEIKISNEINKYAPIKIGLDLSNFDLKENPYLNVTVTTNIKYDNNLLSKETSLKTNIIDLLNPIISKIISLKKPETKFPVNVNIENKIEQTVVETSVNRQIIEIIQPMFCELITDSIFIENKKIVFENLNQPAYLVIPKVEKIDEQIIKNDVTVDNRYYFDLSKLTPITKDTEYTLYDETQQQIIGRGIVYSKRETESDNIISTDNP